MGRGYQFATCLEGALVSFQISKGKNTLPKHRRLKNYFNLTPDDFVLPKIAGA